MPVTVNLGTIYANPYINGAIAVGLKSLLVKSSTISQLIKNMSDF